MDTTPIRGGQVTLCQANSIEIGNAETRSDSPVDAITIGTLLGSLVLKIRTAGSFKACCFFVIVSLKRINNTPTVPTIPSAKIINRLNSVNVGIFYPDQFYSNVNC